METETHNLVRSKTRNLDLYNLYSNSLPVLVKQLGANFTKISSPSVALSSQAVTIFIMSGINL